MKLLGIDFGKSRIGISYSEGQIASPYSVISIKNWGNKIKQIVEKENIDKIIIGISEGEMAEKTKKFANELSKISGKEIILWDEALTTQDAIQKMISAGKSKKFRKEFQDAVAASLILQSYLDNNE